LTPALTPARSATTISVENSSLETLTKLAEASKAQRLPAADEEQAAALLKELLSGGKAGIASAIEPLIGLPWIVGANAVSAVWPTLSVPMRRHLLTSVAKIDSEPARRLRLSLARSIFKIEPAAGLKIAAAAAADLREPETGALSAKHRHMFFNVFIGKGKPWLLQLALGELKGAEADCLVHCAIECFQLAPPLSQLSILRWAYAAGRFKKMAAGDLDAAAKSVSRWKVNFQRQLRTDIPELPEPIAAVLKPEALKDAPPEVPFPDAHGDTGVPAEAPAKSARPDRRDPKAPARQKERGRSEQQEPRFPETPAPEATPAEAEAPVESAPETQGNIVEPAPDKPEPKPIEEITIPRRNRQPEQQGPQKQGPREERQGRDRDQRDRRPERQEQPRQGGERGEERREERRDDKGRRPFDLKESLRGLEAYVSGLRNELEQTKNQLRRREEEPKRGARSVRAEDRPAVDADALLQHNAQLETTVKELRLQLEDLATHHEAVAESRQLHSETPLPEGSAEQLKALLSIKLQESFETYLAMRQEPLDKVFRLDYRDLLGSVFDVLLEQGVELKKQ